MSNDNTAGRPGFCLICGDRVFDPTWVDDQGQFGKKGRVVGRKLANYRERMTEVSDNSLSRIVVCVNCEETELKDTAQNRAKVFRQIIKGWQIELDDKNTSGNHANRAWLRDMRQNKSLKKIHEHEEHEVARGRG